MPANRRTSAELRHHRSPSEPVRVQSVQDCRPMAELNGVPADLDQVQVLGLTNYGHFTSMRVDDQRVRGLSLHLGTLDV